MIYQGQELSGRVELDGNSFINCSFQGATLVYRGGAAPSLADCRFDPAQIEFQDAAANTVRLLGAMARPGSGLRYLAARMLWQILGEDGAEEPASQASSTGATSYPAAESAAIN